MALQESRAQPGWGLSSADELKDTVMFITFLFGPCCMVCELLVPQPGIEPISLASPALAGGFFTTSTTWEAHFLIIIVVHLLAKSCLTICSPMNCSTPSFPVLHYLLKFTQTSTESMMPSNHFILCHPLLLLPSIFPHVRVCFSESALCIRWPKEWSFSFSISPSNEYSGLISFRTDSLDLLAGRRDSQESSSLFLHPLPCLISNYLNLPFETQGRSRRLDKAYFLQTRNLGHEKHFCPEAHRILLSFSRQPPRYSQANSED